MQPGPPEPRPTLRISAPYPPAPGSRTVSCLDTFGLGRRPKGPSSTGSCKGSKLTVVNLTALLLNLADTPHPNPNPVKAWPLRSPTRHSLNAPRW